MEFGLKTKDLPSPYGIHLGNPVAYTIQSGRTITGILRKFEDANKPWLEICPSLQYNPDGTPYISRETPSIVTELTGIMSPLGRTLEKLVEEITIEIEKNKANSLLLKKEKDI